MQKKIKFPIILFIALVNFAFAQSKSDGAVVSDQFKSKLKGTWFDADLKADKFKRVPSFEIKGDTFFGIGQTEKYRIKITADSMLTMYEILTAEEHKTIKPKVSISEKIFKLTTDSLVLLGWMDGRKKYERYYKVK